MDNSTTSCAGHAQKENVCFIIHKRSSVRLVDYVPNKGIDTLNRIRARKDRLEFSAGVFDHYWTRSDMDIEKPSPKQLKCTSVYTHTNIKMSSTQVWMSGPQKAKWKDVSKKYFALKVVPHPELPQFSLSRNKTTKLEHPFFIKWESGAWERSCAVYREHPGSYHP
jgi:hypothetical protein